MVPVKPMSLQLLSLPFEMCISQSELLGKNFNISIFIWPGFRYVYVPTCKAMCPSAIGTMQGHIQDDGSENKCLQQPFQVKILYIQEYDLS